MKGFNAVLRFLCFIAALVVLFTGLATGKAAAAWSTDPTLNNAISTAANNQVSPTITSDGSNGAIITWRDNRGGANYDIYAQRINASGAVTPATPVSVPTMNGWGMMIFMLLAGLGSMYYMRRRA